MQDGGSEQRQTRGMTVQRAAMQWVKERVLMPSAVGLALALIAMPVSAVRAQDAAPAAPQKTAVQKAPAQKAPSAAASPAGGSGDAGLRQRVEQLEEQIVDMQVVIGTLESLAKAPPPSASAAPSRSSGASGSADSARVDSLEQQLNALNSQMQQLSNDMRAQRGDRRSELTTGTSAPAPSSQPPSGSVSSFGSTTVTSGPVTSGQGDPIGGLLAGDPPPAKVGESLPDLPGASSASTATPGAMAALPPSDGGDPQQMYSSAYGYLLGQNYGAAQSGFEEFLRKNPRDALAPDALFWLGEAHYMQKNYKDAAEAFDLVTSSYASSAKAPEAQLRRATALVQLGRKDDACAALRQLNTKYPNARPVLKTKADAERQRAGCT